MHLIEDIVWLLLERAAIYHYSIIDVLEQNLKEFFFCKNRVNWIILDFPKEGAPTLRGGATYDFANFVQKLHEIERIWNGGGEERARPKFYYVDPPQLTLSIMNL